MGQWCVVFGPHSPAGTVVHSSPTHSIAIGARPTILALRDDLTCLPQSSVRLDAFSRSLGTHGL